MRIFILLAAVFLAIGIAPSVSLAQGSCKECSDQQRRCMSNYAGPTCKTEYDRCIKSCKQK